MQTGFAMASDVDKSSRSRDGCSEKSADSSNTLLSDDSVTFLHFQPLVSNDESDDTNDEQEGNDDEDKDNDEEEDNDDEDEDNDDEEEDDSRDDNAASMLHEETDETHINEGDNKSSMLNGHADKDHITNDDNNGDECHISNDENDDNNSSAFNRQPDGVHVNYVGEIPDSMSSVFKEHTKKVHVKKSSMSWCDPRDNGLPVFSVDGKKRYECMHCDKWYSIRSYFLRHQRTHTGEKPYPCSDCGKAFRDNSHLRRHQKIHTGDKPYVCGVCQCSFVEMCHLRTHMRGHTGEKPYSCSTCDKSFVSSSVLKSHEKTHANKDTYPCSLCDKTFSVSDYLRKHLRSHMGLKPARPKCPVCHVTLSDNSYLKTHMRIHTGEKPYNCSSCDRSFISAGALTRHNKTHTGEYKSYMCSVCDKWFGAQHDLKKHIRIHTGERPFKCTGCEMAFCESSHLRRHCKRIHPDMPLPKRPRGRPLLHKPLLLLPKQLLHKPSVQETNDSKATIRWGEGGVFECLLCKISFRRGGHLTTHMRVIHTGERPHLCLVCDKAFIKHSVLARHVRRHEVEDGMGMDLSVS